MLAFIAVLMLCVMFDISVVFALAVGYLIFFLYGLRRGFGARDVFLMSVKGVKTVKNLLITFLMIGMVTGLWRASGTIPVIIAYASRLIHPSAFLLIAFLLNAMVSVLIGTAFGTAATMGVICMTMARAMGIHELWAAGAIVSGVFFGDRCSPVSTSAMLVSELTKTDLYENISMMIRTALVPTVLVCALYWGVGASYAGSGAAMDMEAVFERGFVLHWSLVIPAVSILAFAMLRVKVKPTLAVSIALAGVLGIFVQKMSLADVVRAMFAGYRAEDAELAAMMDGGGVFSMVRTVAIVGLSSSFSGIFDGTGLLSGMRKYVSAVSEKVTPFGATLLTSIVTSMISCNQTLAVILTHQLCHEVEPDRWKMAMYLENTVILMASLIPWSIAATVPLTTIDAPSISLVFACYLYLVPIWNLAMQVAARGRSGVSNR